MIKRETLRTLAKIITSGWLFVAIIVITTMYTTNWRTSSNSGSMAVLRSNGIVTFNNNILMYSYSDSITKVELDALSTLSNIATKTYITKN